jgi:heavy metal sensor kinase
MSTRSLRFQLTAWYASVVIGAFALLGLLMVWELSHYLKDDLGQTQLRRARQIADTLLANVKQTGPAYVTQEIGSVYAPEANDRFIRITAQTGNSVYVSGPPKDLAFNPADVPALSPGAAPALFREQRLPGGAALIVGAYQYRAPDGMEFLVEVGASTAGIQAMLDRLVLQLLVGLPLVVVVGVGGGYFLVRRALSPVDRIAGKAEQITQHNLSERLPVAPTGDELERLSVSLNHMIARLEDALLNAKRFGADASHELRTPLTVLRGELEHVVQDARLAPDMRESLANVLEEVERLARTVEGLFAISRLDAGEAQAEWVQFDLAELATTTADQMGLLAEDKKISLSCEAGQPVPVQGDRARLKQVVVNLIDNAIKYTPEKGAVKLRVASAGDRALLEVADTGIGIPAEALPHVFDRFFRVDKVRSGDPGGAGLGLSIAKSICTAHGAQIEAQSTPGQGSRFRVELPLASPPTDNHQSKKHEH